MSFGFFEEGTTPEEKDIILAERVGKLAEKLKFKLESFMNGQVLERTYASNFEQVKEFEASIKKEVDELKTEPNGIDLLHAIGYIYEQEATQHLGGVFGFFSEFTEKAHLIKGS